MKKKTPKFCECPDPGCPANHANKHFCSNRRETLLMRSDMEDLTGVWYCGECGNDAFESGVFRPATLSETIANH